MPVLLLRAMSSGISRRGSGTAPVPGRWFAAIFPAVFYGTASRLSSSVFHPPQPGHFPTHRGVWYPQAVHSKVLLTFAMISPHKINKAIISQKAGFSSCLL